jgi:hypothetical protein
VRQRKGIGEVEFPFRGERAIETHPRSVLRKLAVFGCKVSVVNVGQIPVDAQFSGSSSADVQVGRVLFDHELEKRFDVNV